MLLKKTNFLPSSHGFPFANQFSGLPLPLPLALTVKGHIGKMISNQSINYGLCGGMVASAYDYFLADQPIPKLDRPPEINSPLYRYLYQRQLNSYGKYGQLVAKFAHWMTLSPSVIQAKTLTELEAIYQKLSAYDEHGDRTELVILGIVYVNFAESLKIWENHQVLAYDYFTSADANYLKIYDPNLPNQDDVVISISRNENEVKFTQISPLINRKIHGFFIIPYFSLIPPSFD